MFAVADDRWHRITPRQARSDNARPESLMAAPDSEWIVIVDRLERRRRRDDDTSKHFTEDEKLELDVDRRVDAPSNRLVLQNRCLHEPDAIVARRVSRVGPLPIGKPTHVGLGERPRNFSISANATISSNLRMISACLIPRIAPFT